MDDLFGNEDTETIKALAELQSFEGGDVNLSEETREELKKKQKEAEDDKWKADRQRQLELMEKYHDIWEKEVQNKHRLYWSEHLAVSKNKDASLDVLNDQMQEYYDKGHPCFENHQCPMIGYGNLDAKVVILLQNPSRFEIKYASYSFGGKDAEELFRRSLLSAGLSNTKDVYYMYVFPHYMCTSPCPSELKLFLYYTWIHLRIIRPKAIVCLSPKTAAFGFSHFEFGKYGGVRYGMEALLKNCTASNPYIFERDKLQIAMLHACHPYPLTCEESHKNTQLRVKWDETFAGIPFAIKCCTIEGERFIDSQGNEKINVLEHMKKRAQLAYKNEKPKKRKTSMVASFITKDK